MIKSHFNKFKASRRPTCHAGDQTTPAAGRSFSRRAVALWVAALGVAWLSLAPAAADDGQEAPEKPAATGRQQPGELPHHLTPPPKPRFHVYLLMGQSNMAGRGKMTEADREPVSPRIWMLDKTDRWRLASHPVHFDKPAIAGVGLSIDFAQVMLQAANDGRPESEHVVIGLIPCAFGGTPLSRWQPTGDLYANAVRRAKAAMKDGVIRGVLWHQGEADARWDDTARSYRERLVEMVKQLREDLAQPDLPFVAGQLGMFLAEKQGPNVEVVNHAVWDLPEWLAHSGAVRSQELVAKSDGVHFDAASLRAFGKRYGQAMLRLHQLAQPCDEPK